VVFCGLVGKELPHLFVAVPEVPIEQVVAVVSQYLERGFLEPQPQELLTPVHVDYVLKHGLPGAVRHLLKQQNQNL
jgi:hypothetical protein